MHEALRRDWKAILFRTIGKPRQNFLTETK
jgi:hypothetical protein